MKTYKFDVSITLRRKSDNPDDRAVMTRPQIGRRLKLYIPSLTAIYWLENADADYKTKIVHATGVARGATPDSAMKAMEKKIETACGSYNAGLNKTYDVIRWKVRK